jgi:DNA-directed RNA polymerase specialized sigma24 family protein
MSGSDSFAKLMERVRRGDADGATELVRRYEPEIRRAVRLRLNDPRLRRVLDSMDVCQSVLANFFFRAAAGQFELDEPEQLLKLLVVMARNKVRDQASYLQAARRDQRRLQTDEAGDTDALTAGEASPSRVAAGRDLLEAVRQALTPEERYLADQRALGREWADLAAEKHEKADALRKRLGRALDRVARQLGLDELTDD